MHYLFETEHFLFRKRLPEDAGRLPETFPAGNPIRCRLEQEPGQDRNLPETLTVEFRSTGALVGEAVIRSRADSKADNGTVGPEDVEVLCRLSRGFCRKDFQAEVVDGVKTLLGCSFSETPPYTDEQLA